jgi:hypothetical protein
MCHCQLIIPEEYKQADGNAQGQQNDQTPAEASPSVGTSHSLHFPKQLFISGMIDFHPFSPRPVFRNKPVKQLPEKNRLIYI